MNVLDLFDRSIGAVAGAITQQPERWGVRFPPEHGCRGCNAAGIDGICTCGDGRRRVFSEDGGNLELCRYDSSLVVDAHERAQQEIEYDPRTEKYA